MKVSLRGGFADRNGIHSENNIIQYKEFDNRTRVAMVNTMSALLKTVFRNSYYGQNEQKLYRMILSEVYLQRVDFDKIYSRDYIFNIVENTIINDDYADVLTIIEFICNFLVNENGDSFVYSVINDVFEKEYVGYRFVNGLIEPITDDNEIKEIEDALKSDCNAVKEHLDKALIFLGDRQNPDYENSIKESISAVEAACSEYLGEKGSLGELLKRFEKKGTYINPVLKKAFSNLFGYTCDANGIRHAGDIGGPSSTFEEAKFMVVACSAFVNYLKEIKG